MSTIIHVTQEDIDAGVPDDSNQCPIAHAIKRQLLGAIDVDVNGDMIYYHYGVYDWMHLCTSAEADFIEQFDNREWVEPFSFELNGIVHARDIE